MRPAHLQSDTYAQWYKVSPDGNTSLLRPSDGMEEDGANRVEWVFGSPGNNDQSITIKDPVVGDSGLYRCESVNGSIFSAIQLIVEGIGWIFETLT